MRVAAGCKLVSQTGWLPQCCEVITPGLELKYSFNADQNTLNLATAVGDAVARAMQGTAMKDTRSDWAGVAETRLFTVLVKEC